MVRLAIIRNSVGEDIPRQLASNPADRGRCELAGNRDLERRPRVNQACSDGAAMPVLLSGEILVDRLAGPRGRGRGGSARRRSVEAADAE
jgi:hypothetical protein